jgi:diguanylate cyclase (GGDEF)-like protein
VAPLQADPLTGLPRHEALLDAIDAARFDPDAMALIVIDLRGFKDVCDRYGIWPSDQVLRATGQRLCETARAAAMVARIGGDEFAVLLAARDLPDAEHAAERVRDAVQRPHVFHGEQFIAPASVGTVMLDHTDAAHDVLEAAWSALQYDRALHADIKWEWRRLDP